MESASREWLDAGMRFKPLELSAMAWHFSKMRTHELALFGLACHTRVVSMSVFSAQSLSNKSWVTICVEILGKLTSVAASARTPRSRTAFRPHEVANAMQTHSKPSHLDFGIFNGFASQTRSKLGWYGALDLVNIV